MKSKMILPLIFLLIAISVTAYKLHELSQQPTVLNLGIFAGSNWDVPSEQSYKLFDDAIERFEQQYPGIKVKYRSGTLKSDYSEWLAQKIIKGAEPDVFVVLSGDFNTFASIGILKNLDGLMKKDTKFDITKMYNNAVRSGQFHGSQYALPIEVVPVLMFVNKTLLNKDNISIPKGNWTWDDFYRICREITKDTNGDGKIDQFGEYGFTWQNAVYTNGQTLFDSDGTRANFDNPGVLEAVNFMIKLKSLNQNFNVTSNEFDEGKVAFRPFMFSGYRVYKPYPYRVKKYFSFDWDCIQLPTGPNGKKTSQLYSFLAGISSRTRHQKASWEFLKFLTYDKETQMNVVKYTYGVPVLRDVAESSSAYKELIKYNPDGENAIDMKLVSQIIENSIVTPRFKKYDEAVSQADKELYQVIHGGKNPDKTLDDLEHELNVLLKQ